MIQKVRMVRVGDKLIGKKYGNPMTIIHINDQSNDRRFCLQHETSGFTYWCSAKELAERYYGSVEEMYDIDSSCWKLYGERAKRKEEHVREPQVGDRFVSRTWDNKVTITHIERPRDKEIVRLESDSGLAFWYSTKALLRHYLPIGQKEERMRELRVGDRLIGKGSGIETKVTETVKSSSGEALYCINGFWRTLEHIAEYYHLVTNPTKSPDAPSESLNEPLALYRGDKLVEKASGWKYEVKDRATTDDSGKYVYYITCYDADGSQLRPLSRWYDEKQVLAYFEVAKPSDKPTILSPSDFTFTYDPDLHRIVVSPEIPGDLPLGVQMELCIEKWSSVIETMQEQQWQQDEVPQYLDGGGKTCAFCASFSIVSHSCNGCPIEQFTSEGGCRGTPYDWWHLYQSYRAALSMRFFLYDLKVWGIEKGLWKS